MKPLFQHACFLVHPGRLRGRMIIQLVGIFPGIHNPFDRLFGQMELHCQLADADAMNKLVKDKLIASDQKMAVA
ncbi:hypothetical protein D3C72_2265860 [compost metagenome]